ncbi:MAG: hypothetical protein H0X46_00725 [Bacteroidetes bacterium]|nr:hypothetical protein [Bacteroidota bacterium]
MKRKINLNRPEISSAEIAKRKNFDSVLKQSANVSGKPLFKKPWFLSSVVAVVVAVVVTAVLLNKDQKNAENANSETAGLISASDSVALEAFYKAEEAKPCISPPVKGLNIPYATFKVIAEKGGSLDFKTGSKIIIPKSAFADEKGNILKGEIELRYREFHDAADFFVSGIPMTYDSAGVKYQFESAGMMEIVAFQNGKQVNMAPQKEIKVELASNYKGTEYNLYKLDTVANNWSCLGKDKLFVNKEPNGDEHFTKGVIDVKTAVAATPEYKELDVKIVEVQTVKTTELAALPKPAAEPDKPQQIKKGKFTFNLDVDPKEFPELSVYKGLLFEVGEENTNFNKSMYDITWDEATIKEGSKSGKNYNLTLKKAAKKYDLIVYPVFEGKDYDVAMKDFQAKFEKYKTTLNKRIASEKKIEEDYQARVAEYKRKQEEMIARAAKQANDQFKQMDSEEKVRRMFAINSFGVYNCDNPSIYPKGVLCTANVKSEKDKNLRCYQVYLVDKQKNGLFTYYKNPIMTFSFNPSSTNMLWTVEDGVIYWLKPEQFAAIYEGRGYSNLKMNRVDKTFATVEELKAYFNF